MRRWRRDHPRSRGVYLNQSLYDNGNSGSSPLARGLPHGERVRIVADGIIPARAGFTLSHAHLVMAARDHPRSRGVYGMTKLTVGADSGSSPLARGLLGQDPFGATSGRIIPARAGFTSWPPSK